MRLYNTETGRTESVPVPSGPLGIYVCGITPYDTTHLGHAFTYVTFDVLVRTLKGTHSRTRYVQNVTDLDDDIFKRARELGISWDQLARNETMLYQADMAALNVLPPDVFPKASETIPQIVTLVARLEARGHAYRRGGNVYFRVSSVPDYGRLSQVSRAQMLEWSAERGGDPKDPRKEDPLDFLLWQESLPSEPRWESPWGMGRPGWHIECSAMALEHLGKQVDIHGGGTDLIFPHHESEIAQSEAATGTRPFVRTWMHVGMLRYQGRKMSKSLRNLVLVRDLLQRYDPDSIRVTLLRHHYRESWEYTDDELRAAADWMGELRQAASISPDGTPTDSEDVLAVLQDDLDTPRALARLERLVHSRDPRWRAAAWLLGLTFGPARARVQPERRPVIPDR